MAVTNICTISDKAVSLRLKYFLDDLAVFFIKELTFQWSEYNTHQFYRLVSAFAKNLLHGNI